MQQPDHRVVGHGPGFSQLLQTHRAERPALLQHFVLRDPALAPQPLDKGNFIRAVLQSWRGLAHRKRAHAITNAAEHDYLRTLPNIGAQVRRGQAGRLTSQKAAGPSAAAAPKAREATTPLRLLPGASPPPGCGGLEAARPTR